MDFTRGSSKFLQSINPIPLCNDNEKILRKEYIPLLSPRSRMGKRSNESRTRRIHMYRNRVPRLSLILIQDIGNLLHRLIMPRIGTAQNNKDPNRILIDIPPHQLRIEPVLALLGHLQNPRLDIEVPRKLLQRHLRIGAHDNIRLGDILILRAPLLLPIPLHREPAEVNRLRRTYRRSADGILTLPLSLLGSTPEIRDHRHAPGMDGHERRVLIRVGQILGHILRQEGVGLALHVRAHEAGEVEIRPPVQVQLVLEDLADGGGGGAVARDAELGDLLLGDVARRVGGHARDDVLGVQVLPPALVGVVAELLDDGVGVDL